MPKYSVECSAPTPLRKNPYQCIAHNEKDAVTRFKNFNGIADTDHAIEVSEVREANAEEDAELGPAPDDEGNDQPDTPKRKRVTRKTAASTETSEQTTGESEAGK
jgi:hypothetical protein